MTTTTLRAAIARLQALPWADYATRTAAGLRACWIAAQLLAAGIALLAAIAYEHRQQIRSACVTAAAALVVAAQLTYEAGVWTRRAIHSISTRTVVLLPQQPLPAVAPITATVAAAREALERLIRRLYPALA